MARPWGAPCTLEHSVMQCAANLRAPTSAARPLGPGARPLATLHAHPRPSRASLIARAAEDEVEDMYDMEFEDADENWDDPSMRLYLDSADRREWERWAETGLFYGFTTNPSILKRDGVACTLQAMRQLTRHAFELEADELQLQAWGTTWTDIYSCGLDLYEFDARITVKVPLTPAGARAAHRLMLDDVPVTLTGVYSTHQVVTALAMGADYVAPYLGRMNDAGKDGLAEIIKMQQIIDSSTEYAGDTRLLVASIRGADEIAALAAGGCNTFTISPAVAAQLLEDPLTLAAAEVFQEHADEMGAMRDQ